MFRAALTAAALASSTSATRLTAEDLATTPAEFSMSYHAGKDGWNSRLEEIEQEMSCMNSGAVPFIKNILRVIDKNNDGYFDPVEVQDFADKYGLGNI